MGRDWDNKVQVDLQAPEERHYPEAVGEGVEMAREGYHTLDQLKPKHSKERRGLHIRDATFPTRY